MTTTPEVPARYELGLNGRGYRIDYTMMDRFAGPVSLKVGRNQADTDGKAGEQSLSRENLWRRTITSWHHGAGQVIYDTEAGDPYRFYKSLGIDVWTPGRFKPLGGVARRAVPSSNSGHVESGGSHCMFVLNGQPHTVGGTGGNNVYNLWDTSVSLTDTPNVIFGTCTNGTTVYLADSGGAIYQSSLSGAAATLYYAAGTYFRVFWAAGRLWAVDSTGLHNITSGSTRVTAVTNPSNGYQFYSLCASPAGGVLAGGTDNSHGSIYFIGILPDGTAITPGISIAELPEGEKVYGMHSSTGYVVVGTSKGVRVCKHNGGGDFTLGPLIDLFSAEANAGFRAPPDYAAVREITSFDRFIYFSWEFYDWGGQTSSNATSGIYYVGVGRLDLSQMNAPLQPAYATDVMVRVDNTDNHTDGAVIGLAIDRDGTPWFHVVDDEVYGGTTAGSPTRSQYVYLGSGKDCYMRSGRVILGVDDIKVLSTLSVHTDDTNAAANDLVFSLNPELGSTFTTIDDIAGTTTTITSSLTSFAPTESVEVKFEYADNLGTAKTVYDVRLAAWPSPPRLERWQIPIVLHREVEAADGSTIFYSPTTELDAIRALCSPTGRAVVEFQFLGQTYNVVVDDYEFIPYSPAPIVQNEFQGTVVVTLSRAVP